MAEDGRTTWTKFGPDMLPSQLPPLMQGCLPPNAPSRSCDTAMGNAQSGTGFCASPSFEKTTYCACVNNAVTCPQNSMAACASALYSYKPWIWNQAIGGESRNETCAKTPICVNLVEVGGSQNLVSGITQQCGTIQNITNVLKTNPTLAILLFILFIAFIVVLSITPTDDPPTGDSSHNTFHQSVF